MKISSWRSNSRMTIRTVTVYLPSAQTVTIGVQTITLVTDSNQFFKSLCIQTLNFGVLTLRPVTDFFKFATLCALERSTDVFEP